MNWQPVQGVFPAIALYVQGTKQVRQCLEETSEWIHFGLMHYVSLSSA